MDYEKAYKDALARMNRAFSDNRCTIGFVTEIFPELKESDDKKIRKELLHFLNAHIGCSIAPSFCTKDIIKWIAYLEKLGEQKPVEWSKEDEEMLSDALDMVEWYIGKNESKCRKVSNWLKSLKDRCCPQSKLKPTKEQLYMLNWVANILLNHDSVVEKEASKKLQSLYSDLKKLK